MILSFFKVYCTCMYQNYIPVYIYTYYILYVGLLCAQSSRSCEVICIY